MTRDRARRDQTRRERSERGGANDANGRLGIFAPIAPLGKIQLKRPYRVLTANQRWCCPETSKCFGCLVLGELGLPFLRVFRLDSDGTYYFSNAAHRDQSEAIEAASRRSNYSGVNVT